ncbi:MAG: hypothetical protein ACRECX_13985 [Methyloceanibacter sp.]|uniref:hypothetical protein n=1 Tax=Methyloceanibacter sp. TaxID=1965321 RepID=UPI003D6D3ADF
MDEVEKFISRLNGMDPTRPYFDPLAVEEALRRHARLIAFRDVAFSWAMGPLEAKRALGGVDFEDSEMRRWYLTMQALDDQATIDLKRDDAVWRTYRKAQSEAETRLAETLDLDLFDLSVMEIVGGDAGYSVHPMVHLVTAALRDLIASSAVDNERLLDLNEAYLPFVDAMLAGLGTFWTAGETFVCLPLPRLTLRDGKPVADGSPAAVWPNGEAYAYVDDVLGAALQSVEG